MIRPGKNALQIVIGTTVQFVADELKQLCGPQAAVPASGQNDGEKTNDEPKQAVPAPASGTYRRVTPQDLIFGLPAVFPGGDRFEYVITDQTGIHARPAGESVKIVKQYDCKVTAEAGGKTVAADSVIELMSLGAAEGTRITFRASGPEGPQALAALYQYVKEKL